MVQRPLKDNPKALAFLSEVIPAMNVGNFDNSDPMTDYFHVGWYVDVNLGRWDKPYVYTSEVSNMWKEMKSFRFVLRNKLNGKTFSYTDHLNLVDKTKEWYVTWVMQKHFKSENLDVVRISKDVSGLGRRFKQVYSESKGWMEGDLTKVNPYV